MDMLNNMLSQLDPKVVYVVVAVMVVLAVLSFIKKAIKLGILIILISFVISALGPMAKDFQEKYNFSTDNGVATVQIQGNTVELNKDTIKDIKLVDDGTNYVLMFIDKGKLTSIDIPKFMASPIKSFLNKYEIPFEITDELNN